MPPKMFTTDGSEKDPVVVYKLYAQKRPGKMNEDDCPFYLAVNNNLKADRVGSNERVVQGGCRWHKQLSKNIAII